MKPICLLFCICFLYYDVYSQTPKDSINARYMVGISLLPVVKMINGNTAVIGGNFAYKTGKENRIVTTLNLYSNTNMETILYPNMADFNLKGLQFKIGMQHFSIPKHYKYVSILIGYAAGLSKNESIYQIILTDNYQNVYFYPVAEKFWIGTIELQGGFDFTVKRIELATYVLVGKKWQTPDLRYELLNTFPMLGYITPDYYINFQIDLWYRL